MENKIGYFEKWISINGKMYHFKSSGISESRFIDFINKFYEQRKPKN